MKEDKGNDIALYIISQKMYDLTTICLLYSFTIKHNNASKRLN